MKILFNPSELISLDLFNYKSLLIIVIIALLKCGKIQEIYFACKIIKK